jgi:hypothetical protein
MHSQPIFFGEADYERWLSTALEAERQRLQSEAASRSSRLSALPQENVHANKEGDPAWRRTENGQ